MNTRTAPLNTALGQATLPTALRVVHSRGRSAHFAQQRRLPHEMRNPRLSRYELEYLNWYHGDPLKRSVSKAHEHSINNGEELIASKTCGCFQCLAIYSPKTITEWVRDSRDRTALCPHCDTDTVLGDASGYPITAEFLRRMQSAWC